jgi:outer membrane protein assembly factor BamB
MTEPHAALAFDRALDGERGISLNGSESLVITAHAIQTLFDRQQAIPSEEFVMQLEQTLFPPSVIPSTLPVIPSEVEGPPAAAVSRPQPSPRPTPIDPKRTRVVYRWAAIAAALILLLGAAGTIVIDPFDRRSTPEPSAIPAAMLGTVEASPAPAVTSWKVAPPDGSTRLILPGLVSNGRVFTIFATDTEDAIAQSVDLRTGHALWSGPLGNWTNLLVSTAGDLLLATATDESGSTRTAYDGGTGTETWQIELEQRPVGLLVQDGRILVLGSGNGLDAFELDSQKALWQADLSEYDEAAADDAGMNKYFNTTGSRLASTDGVVGAIVSNGRLVAVDAADGAVKWADERTTNASTIVMVADGKFVVRASGSDMQGYDFDGAAGTPIPETNRCQAAIAPRTDATPGEIRPNGAGADSFDPATGESPWGIETNRPAWIWTLDKSNLIAMVSPGWDIVNDQPQNLFPCKIDGATGAISDLDGSSLVDVILDINTDTPTGMAGFPNGGSFMIQDIDPAVAASLPHVESEAPNLAAASWLQSVDGRILVVLVDGTLVSMPAKAPTEATPTVATPAADTGWTAHSPVGTTGAGEAGNPHVISDGRIFRMFSMMTGAPHIQAVDAATGDILWDEEIAALGNLMTATGDTLLVAEPHFNGTNLLVARDVATGNEVWSVNLSDDPVAMTTAGNRVLVLGSHGKLDAVDLDTGEVAYAVDVRGDAQNVTPYQSQDLDHEDHRLAVDGDTLYAALQDGSIVAVDLATGTGKWWALREIPGQV